MKTNLRCFCRVLGATLDEGHYIVGSFPAYYLFNSLLCTLQVLNVFWFITIFRMVYTAVVRGQVRLLGRICVARTNLHGNQSRFLFSNNFVLVVVIWFLSCWCFFFQLVICFLLNDKHIITVDTVVVGRWIARQSERLLGQHFGMNTQHHWYIWSMNVALHNIIANAVSIYVFNIHLSFLCSCKFFSKAHSFYPSHKSFFRQSYILFLSFLRI